MPTGRHPPAAVHRRAPCILRGRIKAGKRRTFHGAIKINQAVPGYFNADNLRDLTGINMSNLPATPEG